MCDEKAFPEAEWLSHEIITLRDTMLDDAPTPPAPGELLESIHNAQRFVVTSERDLLEVVCQAIEELSEAFKAGEGVAGYWEGNEPKHEPDCQNVLWLVLGEKLRNWGLACQQERHVGPNRCDWWVELPQRGGLPLLRVALELKVARQGYDRQELIAPVRDQLVQQYMAPGGLGFGIYIVLWFRDPSRYDHPEIWSTAEALRTEVEAECKRVAEESCVTVRGYVLDMTAPWRRR